MSINNIDGFLERFKKLKPTDLHIKESLIWIIKDVYGTTLKNEEIKVSKDIIFLNIHPTFKTELFFKRNEILERLNKEIKPLVIKDIK